MNYHSVLRYAIRPVYGGFYDRIAFGTQVKVSLRPLNAVIATPALSPNNGFANGCGAKKASFILFCKPLPSKFLSGYFFCNGTLGCLRSRKILRQLAIHSEIPVCILLELGKGQLESLSFVWECDKWYKIREHVSIYL